MTDTINSNKEKAIERAKKLMAMAADSSSPHEAAIAARRARSLIDKYQIESYSLIEKSEFSTVVASKPRSRSPLWEQSLSIWIARLNDCIAKYSPEGQFVFSGFSEDATVCEFMYVYLTENGKKTCKEHMKKNPRGCRSSFKNGYSHALATKIKDIIETRKTDLTTSSGTSLVIVKNQLVQKEFGAEKYQTVDTISHNNHSMHAGIVVGNNTNIVTGVE